MNAKVYVTLKPGVLDPQGKAVNGGLHALGYDEITDVRVGKYFELELGDCEDPHGRITEMCETLLANTVIENFRIELEGA